MSASDPVIRAFETFLQAASFPCVGAKSALTTGGMEFVRAASIMNAGDDDRILALLQTPLSPHDNQLVTRVILFPESPRLGEVAFEDALWTRLAALTKADCARFEPDPAISADPDSPDSGMSFGGTGYFVIGMHPGASRLARRAPVAALAFNSHAQFRALKRTGRFDRMQDVVRARDIRLQGTINPMLSDHGARSEAIQYSGRHASSDWVCPFKANQDAA